MGDEIVIGKYHVGCVLGHFRAGYAHGDSDICLFECRGIVHTVSGHCHNLSFFLPCGHDFHLLFRGDTGVDGVFLHIGIELFFAQLVQFRACNGFVPIAVDAYL